MSEPTTYVEITKSEHAHGGPGWAFGTCLWSPSRNRAGHDRYALMREPQRGDRVLHIYHDSWPDGVTDSRLCGQSEIAAVYREVQDEPPSPGDWAGMAPYYRIDLTDYTPFPSPLPMSTIVSRYGEEIRQDLKDTRPTLLPFNTHGDSLRTVQGIYLARATSGLLQILNRGVRLHENRTSRCRRRDRSPLRAHGSPAGQRFLFFARAPLRNSSTGRWLIRRPGQREGGHRRLAGHDH